MTRSRLLPLALLTALILTTPASAWPPYSCYRLADVGASGVSYYAPLVAPAATVTEPRPLIASYPGFSYYSPYGVYPSYTSYSPYIAAYSTTLPPTAIGVPLRSTTYTGYYPAYYPPAYSTYSISAYGGTVVPSTSYYLPGSSYFAPSSSLTPGFNRVFLSTGDFHY